GGDSVTSMRPSLATLRLPLWESRTMMLARAHSGVGLDSKIWRPGVGAGRGAWVRPASGSATGTGRAAVGTAAAAAGRAAGVLAAAGWAAGVGAGAAAVMAVACAARSDS